MTEYMEAGKETEKGRGEREKEGKRESHIMHGITMRCTCHGNYNYVILLSTCTCRSWNVYIHV